MKLRKFIIDYAESISYQANNEKIAQNLRNVFPYPYSLEDAKNYINFCLSLDNKSNLIRAIIVDEQAVGGISLTCGDDIHSKTAEIGYWLGEDYWNRGIMRQAVATICKMGFDELDIVRIYAEVFDYNIGSCKVLEKCGFSFEGTQKKAIFKNGKIFDAKMYSLIQ